MHALGTPIICGWYFVNSSLIIWSLWISYFLSYFAKSFNFKFLLFIHNTLLLVTIALCCLFCFMIWWCFHIDSWIYIIFRKKVGIHNYFFYSLKMSWVYKTYLGPIHPCAFPSHSPILNISLIPSHIHTFSLNPLCPISAVYLHMYTTKVRGTYQWCPLSLKSVAFFF